MSDSRLKLFFRQTLPRAGANLIMLGFFGLAVLRLVHAMKSADPIIVIFDLFLIVSFALFGGLLLANLYLPSIAGKIAGGLIFPCRYLKNAPVMLSPIQGMIAAGQFAEAEQRLTALRQQHPGEAEISLLLVELYADRMNRPALAAAVAETYFSAEPDRNSEAYFRMLMRWIDLPRSEGQTTPLTERLEKELRLSRLSDRKKAAVRSRLSALQETTL